MMPPVAILAGGNATRLYPITKTIPKVMLEVAGKPFISHQFGLLKSNGIGKVVICSGHLEEQIKRFVKDGHDFGLSAVFSSDGKKALGTGLAVKRALPLLGDVFFVMNGDSYLDIDFKLIFDYFSSYDKKGLMTVFKNDGQWDKSNIIYVNGRIVKYDKKNTSADMKYIDYGLSILRKDAFDWVRRDDAFDLGEVYNDLIEEGQMLGYEADKRFYEIGSPQGLAETKNYLLKSSLLDK